MNSQYTEMAYLIHLATESLRRLVNFCNHTERCTLCTGTYTPLKTPLTIKHQRARLS